jgi:xanthine dehydrogenase large subunit
MLGVEVTMIANAGHSADLSRPVMTRALCHFDNAYWLPHVALHGYCARTNTQSNTAFRGFGGPQGALAIEFILDSIARGWARTRWRCARQLLRRRHEQRHALRQPVEDNLLDAAGGAAGRTSGYAERRAEIAPSMPAARC